MSNKYNGWANYATWRINLEFFDNVIIDDYLSMRSPESDDEDFIFLLSEQFKNELEDYMSQQGKGLCLDYAMAFVSNANFYEIAETHFNDWLNNQK